MHSQNPNGFLACAPALISPPDYRQRTGPPTATFWHKNAEHQEKTEMGQSGSHKLNRNAAGTFIFVVHAVRILSTRGQTIPSSLCLGLNAPLRRKPWPRAGPLSSGATLTWTCSEWQIDQQPRLQVTWPHRVQKDVLRSSCCSSQRWRWSGG